MDRRDFMKGAAAVVAGVGGVATAALSMEPATTREGLISITLPAAYTGLGFTITNNGNIPIMISCLPSETIIAPGKIATFPDGDFDVAYP